MKKSILLVLVVALALAVGFGTVASAGADGGAQASAKKKKGCKKKKGKGKAGKSAAASKKKKGCKKAKSPGGGKTDPGPKTPTPEAPKTAPWPPTDGLYSDSARSVYIEFTGGGTKVSFGTAGSDTCFPLIVSTDPAPVNFTPSKITAQHEEVTSIAGFIFTIKWSLELTPDMHYKATIDSSYPSSEFGKACSKPGATREGTVSPGTAPV